MLHNPVTLSALQGELFVVVFEKNQFGQKIMKVMCPVLPEKWCKPLDVKTYATIILGDFFVTQNFRNRVLTYLWERDMRGEQ